MDEALTRCAAAELALRLLLASKTFQAQIKMAEALRSMIDAMGIATNGKTAAAIMQARAAIAEHERELQSARRTQASS